MKKYLIRVLKKLGILRRITIYPRTKINKVHFKIPIINETGLYNYLDPSEPWMLHILSKLLNHEKTFVDIGFNLGQTLLKVKSISELVNYIGFEPNPHCIFYINQLIKANHFSNIEVFPVGISAKSAILTLNLFSEQDDDSSASIIENFRGKKGIKKSINVPVFSFSDLKITSQGQIGLIKIDVEGAELEVLNNLLSTIESDRPFILIEILPAYTKENASRINRQNEIKDILAQLNYAIFRIVKKNEAFLGLLKLESFEIHSDLNLCDYILCPNENTDILEKNWEIESKTTTN